MSEPTQSEINRFVATVDEFMRNRKRLLSPKTRAAVYASQNQKLIGDYESAVSKSGALQSTIEATVGAWNVAKQGYAATTNVTSTGIGDAIDEVRSWFGYDPTHGLNGLGALPAAAWIAGIVSAAYLLNKAMQQIFIQIAAFQIQRDNPEVSRSQALAQASSAIRPGILSSLPLPLIAAAALAGFLLWNRR